LLDACRAPKARGELQVMLGIAHRAHFAGRYLRPLVALGWLELTLPNSPTSKEQRYKTTALGLRVLERASGDTGSAETNGNLGILCSQLSVHPFACRAR
jgi:hypothetical protein